MSKTPKKASTVLKRAREILVERGWTRGCMARTNGRHCSVGAIYDAAGGKPSTPDCDGEIDFHHVPKVGLEAEWILDEVVRGFDGNFHSTINFNDSHKRGQKKRILKAFDKAIEVAKDQERAARKAAKAAQA